MMDICFDVDGGGVRDAMLYTIYTIYSWVVVTCRFCESREIYRCMQDGIPVNTIESFVLTLGYM